MPGLTIEFEVSDEFQRQFKRLAKKYRSLRDDLIAFKADLADNPHQGADLGKGIHKVRFPIKSKNKGKSGGARVITLNIKTEIDKLTITLLTIYDKSEISNVSDEYIMSIVRNLGV